MIDMLNKNKKIIIAGLAVFVIVIAMLTAMIAANKGKQDFSQLGPVRQAVSLDEYIKTDSGFMSKQNAEMLRLPQKQVDPPVPVKIPLEKIFMVPVMVGGGDAIYSVVGQLPGNNFFRLEPENLNKIFSINNPDEALKYVDFLMVSAGRSGYDRIRRTVWQVSDYDKIGCKVMPEDENMPLPENRPVSQAKQVGEKFEVTWIYFTPTVPAGYRKMVVEVRRDGGFTIKDNPEEPFWSCGGGFVF